MPLTAAKFPWGLVVPPPEGALKRLGRGKTEQVGDLAECQFRIANVGHGQVATGIVEDCTKLRAFFSKLAPQGPGGQLQACRHFF